MEKRCNSSPISRGMIGWIQSTSIPIQYESIDVPIMDELRFTGQFAPIYSNFLCQNSPLCRLQCSMKEYSNDFSFHLWVQLGGIVRVATLYQWNFLLVSILLFYFHAINGAMLLFSTNKFISDTQHCNPLKKNPCAISIDSLDDDTNPKIWI